MEQSAIKINNKSDEENEDIKVKRKRRSKNEVEGRSFVCECGKSYLSQPALTNHKKTKHEADKNTEKRGRGRPKKNVVNNSDMIQKAEIKFKTFFDKDTRRKPAEALQMNVNMVDNVFVNLINPYRNIFQTIYSTVDDHPLLKMIKTQLLTQKEAPPKEGSKTCDEIKFDYLRDVLSKTNETYFIFVFKFVLLFRECINRFKRIEEDGVREFCVGHGADSAPDLCNEFIIEFMEVNNYFGLNSEDQKNEFIEVIQHFCLWLYENGHTSSRLTLLI